MYSCQSCKVKITNKNRGGNYYDHTWCKKCWESAKKDVGRSWGGEIDDRGWSRE